MESQPKSPLRRWAIRVGLTLALPVLLAVGAWGWLQYDSARKLNAILSAARANGEPTSLADLQPKPVPDYENAAPLLREAAAAHLKLTSDERSELYAAIALPPTLADVDADALVKSLLEQHAGVLPLIAEATGRPVVASTPRSGKLILGVDIEHLNECRDLAVFAAAVALHRHRQADDAGALRAVAKVLYLAGAVAPPPVTLPSHLATLGIEAMASTAVLRLAPDLRVGAGDGSAAPEAVRALIAALLDESDRGPAMRRALVGERAIAVAEIGAMGAKVGTPAINFYFRYNQINAANQITNALPASDAHTWPAAVRADAAAPPYRERDRFHTISNVFALDTQKSLLTTFRGRAQRRIAAIALAIRLYQIDHADARPAALADLVPLYLKTLPADPFRADGTSFGYDGTGPNARLWTAGENGTDDGGRLPGTTKSDRPETVWEAADTAFSLNPVPAPPPTTRPASTGP